MKRVWLASVASLASCAPRALHDNEAARHTGPDIAGDQTFFATRESIAK